MDLIVRQVRRRRATAVCDIAIEGGLILAVGSTVSSRTVREVGAAGRLVTPPLVTPDIHLVTVPIVREGAAMARTTLTSELVLQDWRS